MPISSHGSTSGPRRSASIPTGTSGDYYGKEPPLAGLAQSLKIVTMHAQQWEWANATFGRKWAKESDNPADGFDKRFAVETALDAAGAARAAVSDANHFLYLVKPTNFSLPAAALMD